MESTYLKESLAKLATLNSCGEKIDSIENRAELRSTYNLKPGDEYPGMCGQYIGLLMGAHWNIESCLRSAERLEVIDREHERLVTIFEALGIDLDEETLSTLELIGKDREYKDQCRSVRVAITQICADVQADEREIEHDQATDALIAGGFTHDEEIDAFCRSSEVVTVTLVNGRECRYEWQYQPKYQPNGGSGLSIETGKSGDFHRLLALIAPAPVETPTEATQ